MSAIQSYVAAMQPGWNLGNTFDSTGADETSWGNPAVTQPFLRAIKAQGYHSIRIPVTWYQHTGPAPDYTIDPAYLARVRQVVGWALADGLYVMMNLHHDSSGWIIKMPTDHDAVLAQFTAVWTQIANAFKDFPPKLSLESVNEPRFSDDWNLDTDEFFTDLNELNTTFHQIVRSSGGPNATRPLVLPTLTASGPQARLDHLSQTIADLNDPNLIATIHYYGYYPFSVNIAGGWKFDQAAQQDLTDTFDRAFNTFVAKGVPVIVGEFGLLAFDKSTGTNTIEQGEKLKFFEYLGYYARQKQLTTMLWDNGQHFDRAALVWRDPALYQTMKASWTGRSTTAGSDLVFIRSGAVAASIDLALNLNGNRLVRIQNGGTTLRRGQDYTLSGSTLTLSAALVGSLTSGQPDGVVATLRAVWSSGADWTFTVIVFDPPVLQSATGSTGAFTIPTAFNGDRLATMASTYVDGGNAGPATWTPYQEYEYSFGPVTAGISLFPAYLSSLTDGTVNLKFYFWSGATVDYTITKSGTTITGAPAA